MDSKPVDPNHTCYRIAVIAAIKNVAFDNTCFSLNASHGKETLDLLTSLTNEATSTLQATNMILEKLQAQSDTLTNKLEAA